MTRPQPKSTPLDRASDPLGIELTLSHTDKSGRRHHAVSCPLASGDTTWSLVEWLLECCLYSVLLFVILMALPSIIRIEFALAVGSVQLLPTALVDSVPIIAAFLGYRLLRSCMRRSIVKRAARNAELARIKMLPVHNLALGGVSLVGAAVLVYITIGSIQHTIGWLSFRLDLSIHASQCSAIVERIQASGIKAGAPERIFVMKPVWAVDSLAELSASAHDALQRLQHGGLVYAHRLDGGELELLIVTEDLGHGGSLGFWYSEVPFQQSRASSSTKRLPRGFVLEDPLTQMWSWALKNY